MAEQKDSIQSSSDTISMVSNTSTLTTGNAGDHNSGKDDMYRSPSLSRMTRNETHQTTQGHSNLYTDEVKNPSIPARDMYVAAAEPQGRTAESSMVTVMKMLLQMMNSNKEQQRRDEREREREMERQEKERDKQDEKRREELGELLRKSELEAERCEKDRERELDRILNETKRQEEKRQESF